MSGIGTGLAAQLGVAEEVTYGTFVPPTRFYEFNSQSLVPAVTVLERTAALGRGLFAREDDPRTFINGGSGSLNVDVLTNGNGLLFEHMLGNNDIVQVAATDEWVQTITPSTNGLRGKSLSIQAGVPTTDGPIQPFNFAGGKVSAWELACALDAILTLNLEFDFSQAFEMTTALGTPTYPAGAQPFIYIDGAVTIDGTSVIVNNATVNGANAMNTNRRGLGNQKREPLANARWEYGGTLSSEFENPDFLEAFIAGTKASLNLTFTGPLIPTTPNNYRLNIDIPVIRFTGEVPSVSGPDVVPQNLPFRAYKGVDPIITIEYASDDIAA